MPKAIAKILIFLILAPLGAQAAALDTNCWNSDHTFYDCSTNRGAVGVSAPIVGETLESNPANLPTEPSPLGLEIIGSDRSPPKGKARLGFATVKGFDGLGFGVGAWQKNTFSAPDFAEHYLPTSGAEAYTAFEEKDRLALALRLGATVVLPKNWFPKVMRVSVGASAGLGQVSGDYSPQVGLVMRVFGLGLGYSENFERLSRDLPRARISVASAGFFIRRIYLGYSYSWVRSTLNSTSAQALSLRIPFGAWVAYGGVKFQRGINGDPDQWHRAGLLRKLNKHVNLGYEYGYYRLSHSVVLQLFL
ncbi:MAG: hypothetical protein EOP11_07905 [Proteobacteria bacterium]|nr:MAG: hypothetical protein EOP11_07905 [Pseudomonadota bacterium]